MQKTQFKDVHVARKDGIVPEAAKWHTGLNIKTFVMKLPRNKSLKKIKQPKRVLNIFICYKNEIT